MPNVARIPVNKPIIKDTMVIIVALFNGKFGLFQAAKICGAANNIPRPTPSPRVRRNVPAIWTGRSKWNPNFPGAGVEDEIVTVAHSWVGG
jgi:hypothetical protein